MSGADDIRQALQGATVLQFPRAPIAVAVVSNGAPVSSQTGENADSAAAGEDGARRGDGGGGRHGAGDDNPDIVFGYRPMTDLGNAERFAGRYRDALRYCPALGWLGWDGRRWTRDGADEVVKRAEHATARAIQDEADALAKTPDADLLLQEETLYERGAKSGEQKTPPIFLSDKLRMWGRKSEDSARLAAMSKRAGAMLSIAISSLDADPMKINVLNGTLRVSRDIADGYVALEPHDPADYITRIAPVVYDPEAQCPLYEQFLNDIQPPDDPACAGMQRFLHAWFGYSLIGDTGEQKMAFLYGTGRNGKGVIVNVVSHIAGAYADSIQIESFLDSGRARAGGQATPDLAELPGVRLLSTSEPKKGAKLDEALIKLFTGGDRIKARHLNKDFFSFLPQAKLTMQGNYRPKIRDSDEGMWSRIKLVPFNVFIGKDKRDPKLFEKLTAESSGILNKLLDGLRDWLDTGHLVFPDAVEAATAEYRADSDPVGRFLADCTRPAEGGRVQATRMHDVFSAWAKANGETVYSAKGLGGALHDRGLHRKKSDNSYWIGIELTKDVIDFAVPGGGQGNGYQPPGDVDEAVFED